MEKTMALLAILVVSVLAQDAGEIWDPYYQKWAEPRSTLPPSVFRELPVIPSDYGQVRALMLTGRLPNFCEKLEDVYWKQPELNPKWDLGIAAMWRLAGGDPVQEIGYGIFPSEYAVSAKPGQTVETCTYFNTAFGVSNYQAVGFHPIYPAGIQLQYATFEDGTKTPTNISKEQIGRYFKVSTTPQELVTGPTYGYFHEDWVKKVDITIEVAKDTPRGKYLIGVNPGPISQELYDQIIWDYKTKLHVFGNFDLISERPMLLIGVDVGEQENNYVWLGWLAAVIVISIPIVWYLIFIYPKAAKKTREVAKA